MQTNHLGVIKYHLDGTAHKPNAKEKFYFKLKKVDVVSSGSPVNRLKRKDIHNL